MSQLLEKLRYSLYVIFHPFDGFYDLKHEKRGSLTAAIILYLLVGLTAVMKRQFSEYLFNPEVDTNFNILWIFAIVVGPYLLWCVSNWCFTSLMDGEGSMLDMIKATGYALTPLIFSNLAYIVLSWVLVSEEGNYVYLVDSIGKIWAISLVFFAMMITQQYTLGKSLATGVLTLVGMGLILFVFLLLFYLAQQVYTFVLDFIAEAEFRLTF